ncbi:huntingtin-like isoform X3 [Xenia sp. Carnegie-2017]|uniref:huntingtin-like isoform X3 n=1 Tax=Xenia sp. Carnegie-2017 TaxID=2897299 RepID=UPI001F03E839|nr:huntingtin-like isoform X3 [Xenia sp. Carnegie-2017]
MALAVADKLLRAFEVLKNFKEGVITSETIPSPATVKRKDSTLSKKERIVYLNTIGDLTCSRLLRNLPEYGKIVAVAIETLILFCDDEDSDVRLVAGDSINHIIKGFMDQNVARIHVELYKEIKKNGNARCLRAALSKFAEISCLIRPQKCRPFITNLLPCIARICQRTEEPVQETLAQTMKQIMPVLGAFMNDKETKVLLKSFLQNINAPSTTTRRTAATSIAMICINTRRPSIFLSWTIHVLLESMFPFSSDQKSPDYCGVLLCLRHIVPHLGNTDEDCDVVMRGSFGVTRQQKRNDKEEQLEKDEKQLLKMYKLIMLSTTHADHNVVTAALETLQQTLLSISQILSRQLLSHSGLAPVSGEEHPDSLASSSFDDIDSLVSQPDSGIEDSLGDSIVDGVNDKKTGTSVADIQELRRHFSQPAGAQAPESTASELMKDTESQVSEEGTDVSNSLDADTDFELDHRRSDSNASDIVTQVSSTDDLDKTMGEHETMSANGHRDVETDDRGVDQGFTIDPVVCDGVPMLHCARVMCSFLLSGKSGEMISDRKVRVSVKSLALNCLAAICKIYPQCFLARVRPDNEDVQGDEGEQWIREVLLYESHHDPIIRGSLSLLIGNFLQSSLTASRYDFETWCSQSSGNYGTLTLRISVLLDMLEKFVVDESSVTVRLVCTAIKQCLPALCFCPQSARILQLCYKLVQLRQNSYWLVKVELLQILQVFDFSLIAFHESECGFAKSVDGNLQKTYFYDVILFLLSDDDQRVRTEAANTLVKLVRQMYFDDGGGGSRKPWLAVAKRNFGKYFGGRRKIYENSVIKTNLSRIVAALSQRLNVPTSKNGLLGYCESLSLLANSYPVSCWPKCWSCDVHAITRSPSPTGKSLSPESSQPQISSVLCNNGGGALAFLVEMMTSSWLTLNVPGHENALLVVGKLLLGIASSALSIGQRRSSCPDSARQWAIFGDSSISELADKVFVHILRLLNIFFHVIDNITPGAHSSKPLLLSKDKDKSPTPIPGAAVQTLTTSSSPSTNVSSPKRLINRSRRNTEGSADAVNISVEKGSTGKTGENEGKLSASGVFLGQFHHLPHYHRLYETVKGVFSNYKVNLKFNEEEKFVKLLKTILTVFAMLLELVTFSDLGKNMEEIIGYFQATVKCEAATTFLCVQQTLRAIFGVNIAAQPNQGSSHSAQQIDVLDTEISVPSCLEDCVDKSSNVGFYRTYFEEMQSEISAAFNEIRTRDQTVEAKESKSFKDLSFIKMLRQRRGSFRPPLKVDKQAQVHSYIRMFEPLVIRALKEYTTSSSIQTQAQVLSILVQLIRLRVNYALLDSEQAFLNFVLKQFEFIEAGQIRDVERFSPHIFQFLLLLSYDCFQPKFNQAKSVFGMSKIIQVCDDLMACGQSARTHAVPALCPIVYDLFDTQATGRNENSKELETQREVFVSMLLRLAQFPEVLNLLVYVLAFYRSNDEKWKKFSRQAVDTTIQLLIKQQIIIDDVNSLQKLESLFDSVAPIALRPIDVILKALFAPANLLSRLSVNRWLAQVVTLLKVVVTQCTEENFLSRATQLGFTANLVGNIVYGNNLDVSTLDVESDPGKVMAHFLVHVLYHAMQNWSFMDIQNGDTEVFLAQLTMYLLLYIQEIIKSGLFKNISKAVSSLIKESILTSDELQVTNNKIKKIHKVFLSLKEIQPTLCLQWLKLLSLVDVDDENWWTLLQGELNERQSCSVNRQICVKGTLLLRSKLLTNAQKDANKSKEVEDFLKANLENITEMSNESTAKTFLRQIQNSEICSKIFIDVVGDLKDLFPNKLEFKKNLLIILDDLHYKQSTSLILLLISDFLGCHYRSITRKCETMICNRLEYCMSLPKKEVEEIFSSDDIESIHGALVSVAVTKRNPRLASLISHVSLNTTKVGQSGNVAEPALKASLENIETWFYTFVHKCCCCVKLNDVGVKSFAEVVHLLHALRFDAISKIMDDEKFNTSLMLPCLVFGMKKTAEICAREFDHEIRTSPFEDTAYFDTYGVDHLFQCTFGLLLRHVQEIIFSVTTLEDDNHDGNKQNKPTLLHSTLEDDNHDGNKQNKPTLLHSRMNVKQVHELSENLPWKRRLIDTTKALEAYFSFVHTLPKAAQLPKAIYCAVCQFGMIVLEVLYCEKYQGENCCPSELITVFRTFSLMLHNRCLFHVFNAPEYSPWVTRSLRSVYSIVKKVFVIPGTILPEDKPYIKLPDSDIVYNEASMLVNYLYTLLNNTNHHLVHPDALIRSCRDVITGLARLTLFNAYVRIPPLVWNMGWEEERHGTELPPLPTDILRERDVLQDFVLRVHSIGWISRQQFEETWAALLGVLSSPLSPEQTSREEDIDSVKSGCLAIQCITRLLLQTTLHPLPGNPSVGASFHVSRQKELPFLGGRAGKKLCTVRKIVEDHFAKQCSQSSFWLNDSVDTSSLYGVNIERISALHSYTLCQISVNSLQNQCTFDNSDEDESGNPSSRLLSSEFSPREKIDVRSCVQFLMELFEQWVSPYTQPKTPLMLLTESVKSLLIISDLFVDTAQYEWLLSELLELYQNYPAEDEIMMEYLLPALCKSLAVLKMEGVIPEKVVKIMETTFKSPHIPLQVAALFGALYLLESHIVSVVNLVIPLVTDYVMKVLAQVNDCSVFGEHRLLVLLSASFYLLEHYGGEINNVEFKKNFIMTILTLASSGEDNVPLHLYHAIIRGFERLVVSFSLSREDSDALVKFSIERLAIRNPQKAISALGLLLTCMYTGKEGDRPSGLFQDNEDVDSPNDDVLLLALERTTALFDRIRKGFRSEARLVSEILPIVLCDFFPPDEVMNKVIGEFVSSQQPHPELMASVLFKVCENLISKDQQTSVKDWILLSLGSFTQRPPLGMAVWSFTCIFIAASTNRLLRALFEHAVSRIGKLDTIDRTYFLLTALDFYHNQNLNEEEKESFLATFKKVAQTGTPYADLVQRIT